MNFAAALINGAMLSVPLTASVWLALRLTPRRVLNATARYAVWWAVLTSSLALPIPFLETNPVAAAHVSKPGSLRVTVLNLEQESALQQVRPTDTSRLPLPIPVQAWLGWLPILWLAASAVKMLRLLLGHCAILRACMLAAEPPPEWHRRIETWRAAAGWRRNSVRIAVSGEIPVPFAAGPFRPAIIIPARLFGQLSDQDLNRIGLHEAAHLDRMDDCAILAQRLLLALFPWHVVVHWIARQIDVEREIACDDRAVEMTGCPRRYAECLTRVVEACGGLRGSLDAATMAVPGSHLSQRVKLLVDRPRHPGTRAIRAAVLPFFAGLLALVLIAAHAPRLVAFAAPPTPGPGVASIPIPQQERTTMSKTVKDLGRKLVVAAAATGALSIPAAFAQTPVPPAQAQVQPASAGRNMAILVDVLGLTPTELQRASDAATKFVLGQLRSDDKVALLISTDRGVKVLEDFTSDRDLLTKTLGLIVTSSDSGTAGAAGSPDRWVATLGAAVKVLSPIAGRKMLVFLNGGAAVPPAGQLSSLVNDALRADVAIYTIDARGFMAK